MNKLSVVIITLNEEENIARCIDSVKGIADEVLVVDSFSADKTAYIAKSKGARVIEHAFEGHIQQKNWAKEQASFDCVLSLDADECLSDELRRSIIEVKGKWVADGYTVNRLNFYCGQPIRTCGWYPDKKLRLWDRTKGAWAGINPHDKFALMPGANISHLEGDILHYTYPTQQAFVAQKEKFATISAQHLKSRNILYLLTKMIFSPPFKFVRIYFFELGFTEGYTGWIICYYQSWEVFQKYFRAIKYKFS